MTTSAFSGTAGKRNLSRDQIVTLLALVIGIAGLLIVFLIPNPLDILAPQTPMLTPQDWPGSDIGTEIFFTDNWRVSYNSDFPWSPLRWEERRGFYQSLYLTGDNVNYSIDSFIDQTVVWYANPDENAAVWKREFDTGTYNGWPFIETHLSSDQPASFLACYPDPSLETSPPQCWYLASWGHWFTAVLFWRQSDEVLLMQNIHQLTDRVDQLLMSAPDEPCYGFLCTNK